MARELGSEEAFYSQTRISRRSLKSMRCAPTLKLAAQTPKRASNEAPRRYGPGTLRLRRLSRALRSWRQSFPVSIQFFMLSTAIWYSSGRPQRGSTGIYIKRFRGNRKSLAPNKSIDLCRIVENLLDIHGSAGFPRLQLRYMRRGKWQP